MIPTPTPYPTPASTPALQIPQIGDQFIIDAVQAWNWMGAISDAIKIGLLLIVIIGGITIVIRAARGL